MHSGPPIRRASQRNSIKSMQKVEIPEIYISLYSSSYNKQIVVDLRRYNNFGRPHLIYLNLYEPTDLHDI